jgi:hypothetical protein
MPNRVRLGVPSVDSFRSQPPALRAYRGGDPPSDRPGRNIGGLAVNDDGVTVWLSGVLITRDEYENTPIPLRPHVLWRADGKCGIVAISMSPC